MQGEYFIVLKIVAKPASNSDIARQLWLATWSDVTYSYDYVPYGACVKSIRFHSLAVRYRTWCRKLDFRTTRYGVAESCLKSSLAADSLATLALCALSGLQSQDYVCGTVWSPLCDVPTLDELNSDYCWKLINFSYLRQRRILIFCFQGFVK